jgi:exodeoxyribonuclease-3
MKKLVSWNVNGLRAVHKKNFLRWFTSEEADIVCLQEIKVAPEQIREEGELMNPMGYHSLWHPAEKPGYSGLVVYSRREPEAVRKGLGEAAFDREGRWLEVDFGNLTLINSYFPNSQRDHSRLGYKLEFCAFAERRLESLRAGGREVLICGDFNIAHKEIDLKNPKSNVNNAGFLPEERAWLDRFTSLGWLDTFRLFEPGPGHYTWWSYRPGVREKNVGWRLDYFFTNPEVRDRVVSASHQPQVTGSDHCPVVLRWRD